MQFLFSRVTTNFKQYITHIVSSGHDFNRVMCCLSNSTISDFSVQLHHFNDLEWPLMSFTCFIASFPNATMTDKGHRAVPLQLLSQSNSCLRHISSTLWCYETMTFSFTWTSYSCLALITICRSIQLLWSLRQSINQSIYLLTTLDKNGNLSKR